MLDKFALLNSGQGYKQKDYFAIGKIVWIIRFCFNIFGKAFYSFNVILQKNWILLCDSDTVDTCPYLLLMLWGGGPPSIMQIFGEWV